MADVLDPTAVILWAVISLSGAHLCVVAVLMRRASQLRRRILQLQHTLRSIRQLARQLGDSDLNHHVDDLLAAVALDTTETH